jgi:HAD superfamily hydrolase (TIGR01662 family)
MKLNIEAILLDVGNTLRIVVDDKEFSEAAKNQMLELLDVKEDPKEFFDKLETRWKAHRKLSKQTLIEASEKELWTVKMLPDYPKDQIEPLAGKLTRLWRDKDGRRVPRPDVKDTIIELDRRGYKLGIIANTITETEIPDWMEDDQVTDYFKTVILSSKVTVRKPNPEIYWMAAREIGVEPEKCAYVGDNPVRDVEGTRAAGYGMMVLINEPDTLKKEPPTAEFIPDQTIDNISDLLDIFPPRD